VGDRGLVATEYKADKGSFPGLVIQSLPESSRITQIPSEPWSLILVEVNILYIKIRIWPQTNKANMVV
jgi:hypothetical protein